MVNTKTGVSLNTEAMISLQLESPSVASYQYNVTTALYYYVVAGLVFLDLMQQAFICLAF